MQYPLESSDAACAHENPGDDLEAVRCGKCGGQRPGWGLVLCRVTCDLQAIRGGSPQHEQAARKRMILVAPADYDAVRSRAAADCCRQSSAASQTADAKRGLVGSARG